MRPKNVARRPFHRASLNITFCEVNSLYKDYYYYYYFKTSTSPPGTPLAFEHFLYPGSQEFNLKGNPGGGEFEPKFVKSKISFRPVPIKRMWLSQDMGQFKEKNITFVSKWLIEKGLTKLVVFLKVFMDI